MNDVDWENLIEEVESLGQSELKGVKALLRRAPEHYLKDRAGPGSISVRKWWNEVSTVLTDARRDLEPGMAERLDGRRPP